MTTRTATTLICGTALIASTLLCGCEQKVNYAPKVSTASKAKSRPAPIEGKAKLGLDRPLEVKPHDPQSDLIAYDEFDGVNRAGWKEPGLGEWKEVGVEKDGAFVVAGDFDVYRELAKPVSDGVVWYAVTMRMESPVTGVASVDGSPGPPKRFGKLGFSAIDRPFTSRGFWMDTERDTKIENTELQTFLTRYSFEAKNSEGFSARDDGLSLIDNEGMVYIRPRIKMDGNFAADKFSHLSLKKLGPEKLIIERVAIGRTAEAVLYPQLPAVARRPDYVPPATEKPAPEPTEANAEGSAKTQPAAPNENNPTENKPAETKPAETKVEPKSEQSAPEQPKAPVEPAAKPEEPKKPQ